MFFLNFSKTNYHLHPPFSVAVHISFILIFAKFDTFFSFCLLELKPREIFSWLAKVVKLSMRKIKYE